MITILLVDDHAMLLEGLTRQFNDRKGFKVVGRATSGKEVMESLARVVPDVITLDVSLPDISGLNLIPRIKRSYPTVRILMLTMYDHERYVTSALAAGADGFLAKGAPFEELDKAVREVVAGRGYVPPDLAGKLKPASGKKKKRKPELSKREFAVFTSLCRGQTLKEVSVELGISDKTVSTYRARLLKKLGLAGDSDLIRYAIENGLLK